MFDLWSKVTTFFDIDQIYLKNWILFVNKSSFSTHQFLDFT